MIYLIGGPPKCGKTTLVKELSKKKGIPWVSTDTLQNVVKPYVDQTKLDDLFPSSAQRCDSNDEKYNKYSVQEIVEAYQSQAKTSYDAIDMFSICEIADGNDFAIEGYHIEPELAVKLQKKYPGKIKSVFLIRSDIEKILIDIHKSKTPNDWILANTKNEETYQKISQMISEYSAYFEKETDKHACNIFHMDQDFEHQIEEAIAYLTSKNG